MIAGPEHARAFAPSRYRSFGGQPLANWGYRVGGWVIDACLAIAAGFAVGTLVAAAGVGDDTAGSVAGVTILAVWLLNTTVLVGVTRGQSIGKLIAGMRIVRDNGRPARFGTGFLRDSVHRGRRPVDRGVRRIPRRLAGLVGLSVSRRSAASRAPAPSISHVPNPSAGTSAPRAGAT